MPVSVAFRITPKPGEKEGSGADPSDLMDNLNTKAEAGGLEVGGAKPEGIEDKTPADELAKIKANDEVRMRNDAAQKARVEAMEQERDALLERKRQKMKAKQRASTDSPPSVAEMDKVQAPPPADAAAADAARKAEYEQAEADKAAAAAAADSLGQRHRHKKPAAHDEGEDANAAAQ